MSAQFENRRVRAVVIGASAGGIEALRNLVSALPPDFSAAVLVVLHLAPKGTSVLPQILSRAGALPAVPAEDGMPIEGGRIYVAPPDCHLIVENRAIRLDHGPRTNGHRPAIDPLFRSAANTYGPETAGVVLSGVLDDGTAGLMAIKKAGGVTLAQDPSEAVYDMMPRTAIEIVSPDHIGTAHELGETLARLAAGAPPEPYRPPRLVRNEEEDEVVRGTSEDAQPGEITGLTCPECNGAIWMNEEGGVVEYACRIGHRYSAETFAAMQSERVESALWTALRSLEERAVLYRRMAERHRARGNGRTAERFSLRAESAVHHAMVVRSVAEQFASDTVTEEGVA